MSLSDRDKELIENQLSNSLSKEDKVLFEERSSDKGFAEEFESQRNMLAYADALDRDQLKAEMLMELDRMKDSHQKKRMSILWYSTAAAITLVSFIFLLQYLNPGKKDIEAIYLSYYQPYSGVLLARGSEGPFIVGLASYKNSDYEQALDSFLNSKGESAFLESQRKLLIGNCYLNLDLADSSIAWLDKINTENELIIQNKNWYTALSLLKKQQIDESRLILEDIAVSNSIFNGKASKLLSEPVFE